MKRTYRFYLTFTLFAFAVLLSSFERNRSEKIKFPYKASGLTEEQATAHLLSRFTFGAQPHQVQEVVKMGLEKWFSKQLEGDEKDDALNQMLSSYDAINLSNTEVENRYPRGAQVVRFAIKEGLFPKDSINKANSKENRPLIEQYMKEKGYRPQQELYRQFINQKILRSTYSENQLREVLTDFWFNHFNVALNKNQCAQYIPAYERDVIRPNVFGDFDKLLIATAKSPAMLMYLDNFTSSGTNDPSLNQDMMSSPMAKNGKARMQKPAPKTKKVNGGLNENYAREVMELHTLGVDGGYTQSDVTQAARILTGWTLAPMSDEGYGGPMKKLINTIGADKLEQRGFKHDGDFFFNMNRHDNGEKTVLGKKFPAGRGYEEGVELLEMLAHHQSTAKFISRKLAIRFVNDNPPQSLVDKMAKTFLAKNGNIKDVLITMVNAPEFWGKDALTEKTKSPFELAISSVRALDATIAQPYQLYTWINKMGQQVYYYQAPTGFPDRGQYWINTGALLNRMNFGLALASQRIPGVKFDLRAINNNHEPESPEDALKTYGSIFMPSRNLASSVERLKPMLTNPDLEQKVATAAAQSKPQSSMQNTMNEDANISEMAQDNIKGKGKKALIKNEPTLQKGNNTMLAQVVGVIIGSPEFQKR